MAIKFLQNLDLASNAISGLVIETGTLPTSSLTNGRLFVDGTNLKYYNGSVWKTLNDQSFSLSAATSSALGGIKIGASVTGKNYAVQLDASSKAFVNVPWTDTQYTLPLAASDERGGVKIGYASSGRNYAVQLDSEKMYVNVPWTDTSKGTLKINVDGTEDVANIIDNTLDFVAGSLVDITGDQAGELQFDVDLSELTDRSTVLPGKDYLAIAKGGAGQTTNYGKVLVGDIHLDNLGDAEADVSFGGNKITAVGTGTAGTDGVNKTQMDTAISNAITSGMDFKGPYNATQALPDTAELGDTYAVTVGGNQANFDVELEAGDLIICQTAYTSGNAAASKYVAVQTNIKLSDASTTVKGIASFADANFSVSSGAVSLDDQLGANSQTAGSATKTVQVTANKQGVITGLTEQSISIPHTQVNDFDTEVDKKIKARQWYGKATAGINSTTLSFEHSLGSKQLVMNLFEAATGTIVMAEMSADTTSVVKVKFAEAVASYDTYELAVQKVEVNS